MKLFFQKYIQAPTDELMEKTDDLVGAYGDHSLRIMKLKETLSEQENSEEVDQMMKETITSLGQLAEALTQE